MAALQAAVTGSVVTLNKLTVSLNKLPTLASQQNCDGIGYCRFLLTFFYFQIFTLLPKTGLLKFRVVAEPQNSRISAKSREIDKNT